MKIIIERNYEEMSASAFSIMKKVVKDNPYAVLGLATGTTPLGLYRQMVADHEANGTSYANIRTINLDEYKGLPASHEHSYAYFMRKNLFDFLDIQTNNIHIENGIAEDEIAECDRYNALLDKFPRDIQLLGIGVNGHIAFNEPNTSFKSTTHIVNLTKSTINANSRLFSNISQVPRKAYTIGIQQIMQAKKILILASGKNKMTAVYNMVRGEITEKVPASVLQRHPNCLLIVDKQAAYYL